MKAEDHINDMYNYWAQGRKGLGQKKGFEAGAKAMLDYFKNEEIKISDLREDVREHAINVVEEIRSYNKVKMKKAEQAVKILQQYAKESGTTARSTSDLSPLEEWLIIKLIEKS